MLRIARCLALAAASVVLLGFHEARGPAEDAAGQRPPRCGGLFLED